MEKMNLIETVVSMIHLTEKNFINNVQMQINIDILKKIKEILKQNEYYIIKVGVKEVYQKLSNWKCVDIEINGNTISIRNYDPSKCSSEYLLDLLRKNYIKDNLFKADNLS